MTRSILIITLGLLLAMQVGTSITQAEQPVDPVTDSQSKAIVERLSDCAFVGRYTRNGNIDPGQTERYEIKSCEPTDQPNTYKLVARIEYGQHDIEAPLIVKIYFADQTPVLTLDQVWIPGLGTFDARVLLRGDRYAGTWSHDSTTGHLFGSIEKRVGNSKNEELKTND